MTEQRNVQNDNEHAQKKQQHINKHQSVHKQDGNTMQTCKPILNILNVDVGCRFERLEDEKLKERKKIILLWDLSVL